MIQEFGFRSIYRRATDKKTAYNAFVCSRYAMSRLSRLWQKLKPFRVKNEPWLTYGAVDFLDKFTREHPSASVLEFGAGGSTIWLSKRVKRLACFEYDARWAKAVRKGAEASVDLRFRERPYFQHIADFDDDSFDLVLIDGRDRIECARMCKRVVRPGGVIMVDNTERIKGRYADLPAVMGDWKRTDFVGSPSHNTTIWIRPL